MTNIRTFDGILELHLESVATVLDIIHTSIADHDSCMIGLSGGKTPEPIYHALARNEDVPWEKVTLFLLDERYVPADSADSNQRMIRACFKGTAAHIVAPDTTASPDVCAREYGMLIKKLWSDRLPDLAIIGMGPDGHIASLFPPVPESLRDDTQMAVHTKAPAQFAVEDRITLTLNPIRAAQNQLVILTGKAKEDTWNEMLNDPENEEKWPLAGIIRDPACRVFACWNE